MIFNFVYWNFGFLRMGTTGITAQAFGAKNTMHISNTLGRSIVVALILAVLVFLLAIPIKYLAFNGMNVIPAQEDFIAQYFFIRILAAPATLSIYAFTGWFFGMQNAWYPLWITIWINVINITVSYYCVVHLNMEVSGVAWGTVIAQYAGLILIIVLLKLKYIKELQRIKLGALVKWNELRSFLSINSDIFLRTLCLTFAFGYFYSVSSKMGETLLAVNLILLQFLNWMSYGIDGVAYASESIVGKYKGAKNMNLLNLAIKRVLQWGLVFAIFYSLMYWIFGTSFIKIFTNDSHIVDQTNTYLPWMIGMPIFAFLSYIWDGVFIGLTASKDMRNSMFMALTIFLLSHFILVNYLNPNQAIWMSLLIFLFSRGVIQSVYFKVKGTNLN